MFFKTKYQTLYYEVYGKKDKYILILPGWGNTRSTFYNLINSLKNDYTIYLEEKKKKIHIGNTSNLSNKMLYILAIMEQEDGKEGDIYVNGDLNNKFQPYFREKV